MRSTAPSHAGVHGVESAGADGAKRYIEEGVKVTGDKAFYVDLVDEPHSLQHPAFHGYYSTSIDGTDLEVTGEY